MPLFRPQQRLILPLEDTGREQLDHHAPTYPCCIDVDDMACYAGRCVPWHWHEDTEFFLILNGQARFEFAGQCHLLRAGEGGFINRNVPHSAQAPGGGHCSNLAVKFSPSLLSGGADTPLYRQAIWPVLSHDGLEFVHLRPAVPWQAQLLGHIRSLLEAESDPGPGQELLVTAALSRAWHLLLRHGLDGVAVRTEGALHRQRLRQMMQCIHDHYAQPLTLEQIGAAAGVSARECSRCFSQLIRLSPVAYLIRYRLDRAAALLEVGGLSVSETALQVGFNNASYFTRAFARQFGVTPKQFQSGIPTG